MARPGIRAWNIDILLSSILWLVQTMVIVVNS